MSLVYSAIMPWPIDVTVCTVIRDNAGEIPGIFDALRRQTSRCFEWLIVDPTGTAAAVVTGLAGRAKFKIRYVRAESAEAAGRMLAARTAADLADRGVVAATARQPERTSTGRS